MGKNTGFGGPVDPEVNCTMPPPLNTSTGGPAARVEGVGQHEGHEADLLAVGRQVGQRRRQDERRADGDRRLRAPGAHVRMQEDHGRRERGHRREQRDALGRAGQRDGDRSLVTGEVFTHVGSPAPSDRVQLVAGPPTSLGEDVGHAQRRGHASSLDGGARAGQAIDDGSASRGGAQRRVEAENRFHGAEASSGSMRRAAEATWASPRSLSERSTSQPPARRADS